MPLNLSLFWLIAFAMLVLALVFVVVPFIRFDNKQSHRGLKSEWYLARLAELKLEFERGQFNQAQYDAAVTELKLTATDELLIEQTEQAIKPNVDFFDCGAFCGFHLGRVLAIRPLFSIASVARYARKNARIEQKGY